MDGWYSAKRQEADAVMYRMYGISQLAMDGGASISIDTVID